jgi:hypothetical protein
MTPDQIKAIIDASHNHAVIIQGWHYFFLLIITGIKTYIGTYFREKGKNLATKEDIGAITDTMEKVRSTYTKEIEALKEKQNLNLAVIHKRLEAHQRAYRLWYDLIWLMNEDDEKRVKQAEVCEQWWRDNHFYLDQQSARAFKNAAGTAETYGTFKPRNKADAKERQKAIREMLKVGKYLREGIGLPYLEDENDLERKILEDAK